MQRTTVTRSALRLSTLPSPFPGTAGSPDAHGATQRSSAGARSVVAALGLFVLALTSAGGASAKEVLVTERGDPRRLTVGTLRHAVEVAAAAGDVIRFRQAFAVELRRTLEIPARLVGLTIDGNAGSGRAEIAAPRPGVRNILVKASEVTLENLRFSSIDVLTEAGIDLSLRGFRLSGCLFLGASTVALDGDRDAVIADNEFRVAPRRSAEAIINTNVTRDCILARNTIDSADAVLSGFDIQDCRSFDLTITENVLGGGIRTSAFSGSITENRVGGRKGIRIRPPDDEEGRGPLEIRSNEAHAIRAERTDLLVADNEVRPAGRSDFEIGIRVTSIDQAGATGPVRILRNTVEGGSVGIWLTENRPPRGGSGSVEDNTVRRANRDGIRLSGGLATRVAGNRVERCGQGTAGGGIRVTGPHGSDVVVEDNTVTESAGIGIRVLTGKRVRLRRNLVTGSSAAGIAVARRSGPVVAEDNTVRDNAGDGFLYTLRSTGQVLGGTIWNNGQAGVFIDRDALVTVSRALFDDNGGPGIDIAPRGVTTNSVRKLGNVDQDWPEPVVFDPATRKLVGTTVPGGIVEVFGVEPDPRAGNPRNGEGFNFLGSVLADVAGRFVFPASGELACPEFDFLTTTVTPTALGAPVAGGTSEFSPDVSCLPSVLALGPYAVDEPPCDDSAEVGRDRLDDGTTTEQNVRPEDGRELGSPLDGSYAGIGPPAIRALPMLGDLFDVVDLRAYYGDRGEPTENVLAYLFWYATNNTDAALTVVLRLAFDDPLELQLDRVPVFRSTECLEDGATEARVPVELAPGTHLLVAKVFNTDDVWELGLGVELPTDCTTVPAPADEVSLTTAVDESVVLEASPLWVERDLEFAGDGSGDVDVELFIRRTTASPPGRPFEISELLPPGFEPLELPPGGTFDPLTGELRFVIRLPGGTATAGYTLGVPEGLACATVPTTTNPLLYPLAIVGGIGTRNGPRFTAGLPTPVPACASDGASGSGAFPPAFLLAEDPFDLTGGDLPAMPSPESYVTIDGGPATWNNVHLGATVSSGSPGGITSGIRGGAPTSSLGLWTTPAGDPGLITPENLYGSQDHYATTAFFFMTNHSGQAQSVYIGHSVDDLADVFVNGDHVGQDRVPDSFGPPGFLRYMTDEILLDPGANLVQVSFVELRFGSGARVAVFEDPCGLFAPDPSSIELSIVPP